jgi:hypothetical protein
MKYAWEKVSYHMETSTAVQDSNLYKRPQQTEQHPKLRETVPSRIKFRQMTIEQKKLFLNVISFIRYQTLQDSINIQRMFCDKSTKAHTKNAVRMTSW